MPCVATGNVHTHSRERGRLRMLLALDAGGHRAVAGAARQADEAFGVALDIRQRHARVVVERVLPGPAPVENLGHRLGPALARPAARGPVGGREQAAEIRVARAVLAQQREMAAVVERDLSARDRPEPERLQRLGHLHGAVKPVVVGQRERFVTLLRRRPRQLNRMRRAVQERVGGVAVELDVRHERMFAQC